MRLSDYVRCNNDLKSMSIGKLKICVPNMLGIPIVTATPGLSAHEINFDRANPLVASEQNFTIIRPNNQHRTGMSQIRDHASIVQCQIDEA